MGKAELDQEYEQLNRSGEAVKNILTHTALAPDKIYSYFMNDFLVNSAKEGTLNKKHVTDVIGNFEKTIGEQLATA